MFSIFFYSHKFTFVLALCHLSIRYGVTTKASLMHCHSSKDAFNYFLLQYNVFLPQEFPLLRTLFSRFPKWYIIYLCEPPQCLENPALKMTKGQLTWIVLTCNVVWHATVHLKLFLHTFAFYMHYYASSFYELIYWKAWEFVAKHFMHDRFKC